MESGSKLGRELETQLDFEKVLSEVSAQFINAPTDRLSTVIDEALKRICEYLDCDITALWQWSADDPSAYVLTNLHRRFGGPPVPEVTDARQYFPWTLEKNLRGETVVFATLDEVPPEGARDADSWRRSGIKSSLVYPLSVARGGVLGSLAMSMSRQERTWPEILLTRLHLVAQICANALARARAEKALRESEARLNLTAESAEAGLWSWDIESNRIWSTSKTRELYGYSPYHEMTYEEFFTIVHPEDREIVRQELEKAIRTQKKYHAEYRVLIANAEIRWIAAFGRPYYKATGKPDRMMGVSLDVTSSRQREKEVQQLRLELGHVTRVMVLGEMSASLAHELNQPLAAILNNAEAARLLAQRGKPDMAQIGEILEDIIKDDQRGADVIRKIRGWVRKSEMRFEELDITDVIDEVVDMVHSELILRRVELSWETASSIARILGDRVHVQQVMLNLIMNAIEAMKDSPVRRLTIRTVTTNGRILVSVSDTGTGIDEEMKNELFKPFYTTRKEGLGMGLRICQSIVQAHGGKVRVENNPGVGATISFSLAIAERAAAI